MTPQYI